MGFHISIVIWFQLSLLVFIYLIGILGVVFDKCGISVFDYSNLFCVKCEIGFNIEIQ